eukprot:TRINITY_DN41559_c0_g2_i1.p1 TRINITY_DN41559_c0_g2~~TRINITY_DN41559_c0_g2_i1.p1  ORF type:complete len:339 (+),score=44.81 TRINITY_DN41559_c0_g2_i1:100-1116(+)
MIRSPPRSTLSSSSAASDVYKRQDYFPIKVSAGHSPSWSVTYYGYYKIVLVRTTAGAVAKTYLLVQDGCPTPSVSADVTFNVPVSRVGLGSSTYEAYVEMLGERTTVVAKNGWYTSSPCMNLLIDQGQVEDATDTCPTLDVAFDDSYGSWWGAGYNGNNCAENIAVEVRASGETQLLPQLEWLEFFSLFYNQEREVETYLTETEPAIACLQSKVEQYVADQRANGKLAVKVLWATPPATDGGLWTVGSCPNYYCEMIAAAGGDILNVRSSITSLATSARTSTNLFQAGFAADVDIILSGTLYDSSYSALSTDQCSVVWASAVPAGVPAMDNQRIYAVS